MHDRQVVFALATKLVARMYLREDKVFTRISGFWDDVADFYRQYLICRESIVTVSASPLYPIKGWMTHDEGRMRARPTQAE